MMAQDFEAKVVTNSVDFRDAVMPMLATEGVIPFVRNADDNCRLYRAEYEVVGSAYDLTMKDLLRSLHRQIPMEDFASAMARATERGETFAVEVFAKYVAEAHYI